VFPAYSQVFPKYFYLGSQHYYDLTPLTKPKFERNKNYILTQTQLAWFDGRCVQGAGAYSPRDVDPRLLRIPASRG
jgi:hypothetical protein